MANYFAFVDESGVLDQSKQIQPFFGVGFLKIIDTSVISEKLTQRHYDYFSLQKNNRRKLFVELRNSPRSVNEKDINLLLSSTRHHEYKFVNITYTTLARYKAFLDTAFEFPLEFCALVIDKMDPLFDSTFYKDYWSAYITYTKLLCKNNCGKDDRVTVIADYMNKPRDSKMYFETELNKLPNVFNTLRAHSETFTLLQICDLMLGSVLFQWRQSRGLVEQSNRAKAKKEFVEYLVGKLKIPNNKASDYPLSKAFTCPAPLYFSVWPLKLSPKTKSGGV